MELMSPQRFESRVQDPVLSTRRSIAFYDLPFDILFVLLDFVSAVDIANLSSTCRVLHAYARDDSIWQRLCARHGVWDVSYFRGLPFYTVYTQLLHIYAPLIGLWANDYPYRGNILEFRLVDGNESETGGIVGEVWRFPEGGDVLDIPHPPRYVRALKISFDDPRKPGTDVSSPTPHVVSYSCSSGDVDPEGTQVLDAHPSAIEVMPQTTQGHFLQFYRRTHGHPDFPAPDASWYDTERGLPRLQESNLAVDDQRELVSLFPAVRLPVIYTSSTGHTKPAAITISCSRNNSCTCMKHHLQTIIFDTLDIGPPRYYPLRGDIKAGMDPHSEHWTLSSLTGLWLGSFGQHKTECLYLDCDERRQYVKAWKITGDIHVPRGVWSWAICEHYLGVDDDRSSVLAKWLEVNPEANTPRVFNGIGTVAERGYPRRNEVRIIAGVTGPDEIQIWWDLLHDIRSYIRYKGREPLREVIQRFQQ